MAPNCPDPKSFVSIGDMIFIFLYLNLPTETDVSILRSIRKSTGLGLNGPGFPGLDISGFGFSGLS